MRRIEKNDFVIHLLDAGEEQREGHCFGSLNLPRTPNGRVTVDKSFITSIPDHIVWR
jgi:hypothetical protein